MLKNKLIACFISLPLAFCAQKKQPVEPGASTASAAPATKEYKLLKLTEEKNEETKKLRSTMEKYLEKNPIDPKDPDIILDTKKLINAALRLDDEHLTAFLASEDYSQFQTEIRTLRKEIDEGKFGEAPKDQPYLESSANALNFLIASGAIGVAAGAGVAFDAMFVRQTTLKQISYVNKPEPHNINGIETIRRSNIRWDQLAGALVTFGLSASTLTLASILTSQKIKKDDKKMSDEMQEQLGNLATAAGAISVTGASIDLLWGVSSSQFTPKHMTQANNVGTVYTNIKNRIPARTNRYNEGVIYNTDSWKYKATVFASLGLGIGEIVVGTKIRNDANKRKKEKAADEKEEGLSLVEEATNPVEAFHNFLVTVGDHSSKISTIIDQQLALE